MKDLTTAIVRYESGELDETGIIDLFQHLIDTGLAWQLQGHYSRTAVELIQNGSCHQTKRENRQETRVF